VALDFLSTDAGFEKSGITNILLPAPLVATDGWAIGVWCRLKSSILDSSGRNPINQILQLSPTTNGVWNGNNAINIWWAANSNTTALDNGETVAGKFHAAAMAWVAGNNSSAGTWSDIGYPSDDADRLLVLQLVNVAGSWKFRLYVTAKGASATLVNESPTVLPVSITVDHLRFGNRIVTGTARDWRDVGGQVFLLKRPLSPVEITQLASGSNVITNIAVSGDILGYWPAETAGATLIDASGNGNDLSQVGTAASYAGFDFVSSSAAAITPVPASHFQSVQSASLTVLGTLLVNSTSHSHAAQVTLLNFVATSITRPVLYGDIDLALSSVSNATSASPLVTLFGDPEANQSIPNCWQNLCANIAGVLGKVPQFSIANAHEWRNGAAAGLGLPQRGWRPWWRVAGGVSTSWQRFDGYTVSGTSVSFANAASFAVSAIEVAFFPVWNLPETNALIDSIYSSGFGSEPPQAINYRSTRPTLPLGTHNETAASLSPDGIAVPVLPMRSARISSPATLSPEGLPKRKAILLFNIHAQEASGGWVADRVLRLLLSTDTNAIWLRDRFVFDCYAVNNSGLAGAASRGVVEGWSGSGDLVDPNRSWPSQLAPPNGPSPEVNDVASAIVTDSGGKTDVLISYHSDALTSVNYGLAYYNSSWDTIAAIKAFKDALIVLPEVITLAVTLDQMAEVSPGLYRDQGFGRHVLGAPLSWIQESSFATSDYLADSQAVATRQLLALRQLTEAGLLPVPIQAASALHGHQGQASLVSVLGALAPQRATHGHNTQSPNLLAAPSLSIHPSYHGHAGQSAIIASGAIMAPTHAAHGHVASLATLIAAAQLSARSARHDHTGRVALLSVPGNSQPRGRIRPVANDRRTLKLRFS
jgi:hypothetical protein